MQETFKTEEVLTIITKVVIAEWTSSTKVWDHLYGSPAECTLHYAMGHGRVMHNMLAQMDAFNSPRMTCQEDIDACAELARKLFDNLKMDEAPDHLKPSLVRGVVAVLKAEFELPDTVTLIKGGYID